VTEPRWLTSTVVMAIHADQISKHGGSGGLRDRGLLESALERPRNRYRYEKDSDLSGLAASYGFGIANNQPFLDGNKRVAFQTMYVFLGLNGLRIESAEEAVVPRTGSASPTTSPSSMETSESHSKRCMSSSVSTACESNRQRKRWSALSSLLPVGRPTNRNSLPGFVRTPFLAERHFA